MQIVNLIPQKDFYGFLTLKNVKIIEKTDC